MLDYLHFIIIFLLLLISSNIFLANNPVYSALYLILTYCVAAIIAIGFGAEFIGLLFITVYVGAVAVLFLFVIMMINIKNNLAKNIQLNVIFLILTGPFLFLKLQEIVLYTFCSDNLSEFADNKYTDYFFFIIGPHLSNTELIGQLMFNVYGHAVLVSGLILLIALIGSIKLTIEFKEGAILDQEYYQLSRSRQTLTKLI